MIIKLLINHISLIIVITFLPHKGEKHMNKKKQCKCFFFKKSGLFGNFMTFIQLTFKTSLLLNATIISLQTTGICKKYSYKYKESDAIKVKHDRRINHSQWSWIIIHTNIVSYFIWIFHNNKEKRNLKMPYHLELNNTLKRVYGKVLHIQNLNKKT